MLYELSIQEIEVARMLRQQALTRFRMMVEELSYERMKKASNFDTLAKIKRRR